MGAPSTYTEEIADEICDSLAEGKSMVEICRADHMPNPSTVYRWLEANEAFRNRYARAREDQADTLADEIIDIADDAQNDWMERQGDDASIGWQVNGEHVQRSKLRIESRKWIAAKLKPKKYGERVELGGNVGMTVNLESDANKL